MWRRLLCALQRKDKLGVSYKLLHRFKQGAEAKFARRLASSVSTASAPVRGPEPTAQLRATAPPKP